MTTILCPTRGGEQSFPNQDRAIAIAKERGAELLFLYVSDIKFLERLASPILVLGDVQAELDEMGEFMLMMAQERAENQGIHADTVVRRGSFSGALADVIEERNVTTLVLGSPVEGTASTTTSYLESLIQELTEKTGVEIILLHQGEIIER